jgi:2-polyprenyl-3-methyl-5-hydroxy-6-metoxy-1,4-benzoquinol methylase
VDLSSESIAILRAKYPNVTAIVARAEDLDFVDGFFDEICCFDVLEHVDDLDLVMLHIKRLLSQDGMLYIEVPYDRSEQMLLGVNPDYHTQI